ncbi:MAG: UDP-N-acetylglucosamine--N-acetylmuramyl-(pentapeptide) pyrophosphoryl-undecaprenol N-acetylglucosamine transferase [Bifidobacteriaceae bacterium]|nr:UDP-N-acetylglucosamine--N-acetylmuramyl-(pentapeptide) pyrophosphoryl-undecaprenol N-acetylglucosamine transferase [Bifidobacteriaceae bacterium]
MSETTSETNTTKKTTGGDLSVVLAGGGTAGHVNPLLSIASAIRMLRPDAHITVIGTQKGLEARLVPAAGFDLKTINKVPFPRRPNLDALKFPARWIHETRSVRHILEEEHADVVVGVGGYAAAPAYRAGHKAGLPVVIHEQNAKAGLANKLGARWADFVGTAYDNTGLSVREGAQLRRVGLPLREAIATLAVRLETDPSAARTEAAAQLGLDPRRPVIVVTGGSLGALSINRAVSASAAALLAHAQVVHLTGKNKIDDVRKTVTQVAGRQNLNGLGADSLGKGDYHVAEYLEHIELAFACADLVVCRSGAGTVSEIAALGLPAIYVPFPIGNGEQRFNAAPVVAAGGGQLIDDADFTAEWVKTHVPDLLADTEALTTMRQRAWTYGVRDAADTMAHVIIDLATKKAAASASEGHREQND